MTLAEVWSFIVLVGVFLIGFGSADYFSNGYSDPVINTWVRNLLKRVNDMFNGVDLVDELGAQSSAGWGVYTNVAISLIFTFLVILMMMNLLIAIMTSAYEQAREDVGASYWAKKQYTSVLKEVNQRHMFVCQKRMAQMLDRVVSFIWTQWRILIRYIHSKQSEDVPLASHPVFRDRHSASIQSATNLSRKESMSLIRNPADSSSQYQSYRTFSEESKDGAVITINL